MILGHADSAATVYVRVRSALYEAILATGACTTQVLEPLATARQLARRVEPVASLPAPFAADRRRLAERRAGRRSRRRRPWARGG